MYRISRKQSYLIKALLVMVGCYTSIFLFGQPPPLNNCGALPEGIGAGKDRILCFNQVFTELGECNNGGYICKWTSEPPDQSLDGQQNSPNPSVSPNQSTIYSLEMKDANGNICNLVVRVLKIEGLTLETIEEDEFIMDDLEVMEDRMISVKAMALGSIPLGFDTNLAENKIKFKFEYQDSGENWLDIVINSSDLEATTEIPTEKVSFGPNNIDHYYAMTIKVSVITEDNHTCTSAPSSIEAIFVYELWMDYFRDVAAEPDLVKRDWKVAVDRPIEYKAIASVDCNTFEWEMVEQTIWHFDEEENLNQGIAMIPAETMPEAENWDYFGDAYGTVNLSCADGEGNYKYIFSRQTEPWMVPDMEEDIQVFFEKDASNNPDPFGDPNWFYYWKEIVDHGLIQTLKFDWVIDNDPDIAGKTNAVIAETTIADIASLENGENFEKGIRSFYSIMVHEAYHIYIWHFIWWQNGYNPALDTDDNDGIPNPWEQGSGSVPWGFDVTEDDSYESSNFQANCPVSPCYQRSAGYNYEEYYCRELERDLSLNGIDIYDEYDWSMDPTGEIPGQRWEYY